MGKPCRGGWNRFRSWEANQMLEDECGSSWKVEEGEVELWLHSRIHAAGFSSSTVAVGQQ